MYKHDAIDEVWFGHFLKIKVKYDKLLTPDPSSVLFSNEGEMSEQSFKLNYSFLKKENFFDVSERISNLRALIEADVTIQSAASVLWTAKLIQIENQISLLKSIQSLMIQPATPALLESTQRFLNETIGTPNQEIFDLSLAELNFKLDKKEKKSLLRDVNLHNATGVALSYEDLLKKFPFVKFERLKLDVQERVDIETLKSILESELTKLSLKDNWVVKIDSENKYKRVLVFYANKTIILPSSKIDLLDGIDYKITYKKCLRLVAHEIKTHVLRSSNGFNSKLKLLSVGLDSYAEAEEGLATFREQEDLGTGKYFAGFNSYLAIGLAFGMDRGNSKRSPHELFELLVPVYHSLYFKDIRKAQYAALKRVLRTYVSFDAGYLINTRDLYYRSGNIKIHAFYSDSQMSEESINAGIFDPTNEVHVQELRKLGVI